MRKINTDDFIAKAKWVHGDKYDYSKVKYINNKTKVCIICPEHWEFWQTPNAHLRGDGCPTCGGCKHVTTEDFIRKSREVHGDKYDYSKVEYKSNHTKVCIICPEHGEFWQDPSNHLNGQGCPKCWNEKRKSINASNTDEFINKAKRIHGNKYDYSKVEYKNNRTKVCIICQKHGEFWQTPNMHLYGQGCPECGKEKRGSANISNTNEFIDKARIVHDEKYDYSKVDYKNNHTKVCIICPEHGEFWQIPSTHLQGCGCPECGKEKRVSINTSNAEEFINKANEIHNGKHDYSKVEYINSKTRVCIICPEHGEFWQTPNMHLYGHGCPSCGKQMSKAEDDIMKLLQCLEPQQRNRNILNNKEIDIYIPSLKLGIEYNGLRWHSEEFGKDKHYHIGKLNECNENGIRLIQIFEDEWTNHKEIVESKLKQICGLNNNDRVFARKCNIVPIGTKEAKMFLNKNHIQGFTASTVYFGAFHDKKLIGVMTFKREKDGCWDLNRFATDINCQCVGVGGKLFKYFTKNYDFIEIKSFADRRWTTNPTDNLYTKLGFEFVEFVKPDYRYFKDGDMKRYHKFGFRKQILHKKYGLPLTITEHEMTKDLGYTRIWDCGLIKYVYRKQPI